MEKNGERENILLIKILSAIRRYLLLIILVIAVFIAGGVAFSFLRTTYYIASEAAVYSVQNTMADENDEASHINAANGYLDTFADFIDEGNVISRANYYYYLYKNSEKDFDDFVSDLEADYEKKYTYAEIQSNIGKTFNIFCDLTVYSQSGIDYRSVERMYTGKVISVGADGITFERGGNTFTIKETSHVATDSILPGSSGILTFRYATELNSFQPDYDYENLEFALGISIKVYKKNTTTGEENSVTGTLKEYSPERIIIQSGDSETGIPKEDFISAYANYPKNIFEDAVTVSHTPQNSSERSYGFTIQYKDRVPSEAKINVRLVILAAYHEANVLVSPREEQSVRPTYKYFRNVRISLTDMGSGGIVPDISKFKIVLIFGILGICAAAIAVYIAISLDRTIKTKKQLESITGLGTLAVIEDGGMKK